MTDDLRELKAGAAAVDPEDYNALIDAVVAGNGGSQPYLQRAPEGDVTVPDGGCIISVDYYEPTGALTLDGDAVLEILT